MSVHVRFYLRRRPGGPIGPVSALHIPGRDASALLDTCARVGINPSGRIHDLNGGFLIRLPRPTTEPVPGATRLRELAESLYVPVDADLVPSLLDDEAAGMVRDGGLVFLPAGPLRFDRDEPVRLSTLLNIDSPKRRNWRPMPAPRPIADRIVVVSREIPETPPEELYRALEDDVRHPDRPRSRPERAEADAMEDADGGESTGVGLIRMAASGLGEAIRGLVGRARSLREKAQWGMLDHSSLVKKLLREFRQGNIDRALRHSFSMREADPRARRVVSWGLRLPFHWAIYNLKELLGGPERGGAAGIWQARSELMQELREEYRKTALRAIQSGDFRRAAYIYGVLLDDHRAAALALQRGGLHHDAAILYSKKLNDRLAAAQAFEAAGLVDHAIALYTELGLHETAGDLLRRIGDEPGARSAYSRALVITLSVHPPIYYLDAGRIADHKMGLPEVALTYYSLGWAARPSANATLCALQMIRLLTPRGESTPLMILLDEADDYFEGIGSGHDAGLLYNAIAGAVAASQEKADEVRDRARSGLARVLRRQVEAGRPASASVSSLFPASSGLWTPAFLRDAQFAARTAAALDRPAEPELETRGNRHPQAPGIQVGRGTVTATCHASDTSRIFLGFADGQVLAFDPRPNRVVPVGSVKGAVAAIAAAPEGDVVVVLRETEQGATLTTFLSRPDGTYRPPRPDIHSSRSPTWLTPILPSEPSRFIGLGSDRDLMILDAAGGLPMAYPSFAEVTDGGEREAPACALLLPDGSGFTILTHDGPRWVLLDHEGHELARSGPAFRPHGGSTSPRCTVPLSWTRLEGMVRVVGLDAHGGVHSAELWFPGPGAIDLGDVHSATTQGGYRAATRMATGKVVAVSATRIDWLSESAGRFHVVHSRLDDGLAGTVACFPATTSEEVLIVSGDGFVSRMAIPRVPRRHRG